IPCYNEEENLKRGVLEKVGKFLKSKDYLWEVIIVDDGSEDNSREIIKKFLKTNSRFTLIENPHQGKGATVIAGILESKGKYVLFTDLDQATPISEIDDFLPWFKKGFDIVIGSRKEKRKGAPFFRLLMARGFSVLRNLILGLKGISDSQCGFKAFKNEVAQDLFKRLKVHGKGKKVQGAMVTAGFDIETLLLAQKRGYKVKEIPVQWQYVETRRVNPLKDSWQGFLDLIQIKINELKGMYD
ncbi:glycosyltransferase, partial [Candidatus Microgenomates bacterium]|nr:glycosyltransferase [Candidatus Microgenomates bacterium]